MEQQRMRGRDSRDKEQARHVYLQGEGRNLKTLGFVGYDELEVETEITSPR